MDQKINQLQSITSKLLLVMLSFSLFTSCKKEERHRDVFEMEVNGQVYKLRITNNSGTPGENAFLQGNFEDAQYKGTLRLDLCNLEAWVDPKQMI